LQLLRERRLTEYRTLSEKREQQTLDEVASRLSSKDTLQRNRQRGLGRTAFTLLICLVFGAATAVRAQSAAKPNPCAAKNPCTATNPCGTQKPLAAASSTTAATPERLLTEIQHRERELDLLTRELYERERSIEEREAHIDDRIGELERIRETIEARIEESERRITEWDARAGDRAKRLSKVYAEMPPGRAAPLLEQLDPDLATQILSTMKQKDAAAVMALMSDERAVGLSQRVARPVEPISGVGAGRGANR